MQWEAPLREAGGTLGRSRRLLGSVEPEELEADFRGMVRRLRQSPLRRATPSWAAPGELWRQVVDPMRDNTPKKHGAGYKARWLALFFQSRLWQGIGRVRRSSCVPMWWHRSITFPIDKSNNKEGCTAVRLVNASSPDSKAFYSYFWRWQPQTQQRAYASGCTAHRSRLESIAQIAQSKNQLCDCQLRCCQCPSFCLTCSSLGGLGGDIARRHGTPETTLRACHDGNTGCRQEHPYPTRVQHSPGQRGSSGCERHTTNVLTNGPITCELNCCKRRSSLKHLLRPQIFSIRLFLWGS